MLSVIVGGNPGNASSGRGGSFVFTGSGASATPLVIAGGGGSTNGPVNGLPGQAGTAGSSGGSGSGSGSGAGGQGGGGGFGGSDANFAGGGGGGFFSDGGNGQVSQTASGGGGGQAGSTGAAGGTSGSFNSVSATSPGGFGGGGGSYLTLGAFKTTLLSGVQSGNGLVTIEEIMAPPTMMPEPASLALLGMSVAGMAALRRRARG